MDNLDVIARYSWLLKKRSELFGLEFTDGHLTYWLNYTGIADNLTARIDSNTILLELPDHEIQFFREKQGRLEYYVDDKRRLNILRPDVTVFQEDGLSLFDGPSFLEDLITKEKHRKNLYQIPEGTIILPDERMWHRADFYFPIPRDYCQV